MRRSIFTLALAGLFAGFLLSSDASACHKKKACATPCQTVVVAAPAPVCEAPAKKKCGFKMPKMKMGGCHKKAAPVCETASYAAPTYAAPAPVYAAPQASHQGM